MASILITNVETLQALCYNAGVPRHSRIKSKTNIYHVMSRGLNKQLLFDDETDYLRYLQLLNDIKKEYGIKVYAYCLMSNHVHIILKDDNEMLSTAMRRLNSRYAMYYNRKKGILMMQLSRVTNIYYNKIQKLKKGRKEK